MSQGQIIPKGPRRWLVRWYVGRKADGRRQYRSKVVHGSHRDAQKVVRSVLSTQDDGSYVDPSRLTLDEFLDRWLGSMRGQVTDRTYALYDGLLRLHVRPAAGHILLQRVTTLEIQSLVDAMQQHSAETKRKVRRLVGQALRQAVAWQLLHRDPSQGVKVPKKKAVRQRNAFTVEQLRELLAESKESRSACIWSFLAATGARPQEAMGLRWSDVDLDRETATLGAQVVTKDGRGRFFLSSRPKTEGSLRLIPLPSVTVVQLIEHRRRQRAVILRLGVNYARELDLVFPTEIGTPMDLQNLNRREFKPLARRIGIPQATPYWLRHTVATQLLSAGENPKVVAERLGHTSTQQVLDTYGHVLEGMQQSATEKLNALLYE